MATHTLTMPPDRKTLEKIVKFVASHMKRESSFLNPDPQTSMNDPYGLLEIVEEAGVEQETIDRWMCEAQKIAGA